MSKTHKAIKYKIYPTAKQQQLIAQTFGCCRFVYNNMLTISKEAYEKGENICSRNKFNYLLTDLKKRNTWLKDVDSTALTAANDALADAFSNFFAKRSGYPNFHKKKSSGSYTSKRIKGSKNIALESNAIRLPKLGIVKAKIHRLPKTDWEIKSATISQSSDGKYYVSVLFEFESDVPTNIIDINNSIGLDYASDGLFVDSNGNIGSNHKFYRKSHKKLTKAQRKLSRMIESNITGYKIIDNKRYPIYKKDISECKNIQKQKLKIAKISRHTANQRLDNLHKLSAEIANQYDVVCVESLNMKAIANKGFGNGKATLDNGYGLFLNMLEYKLADRNKIFVKIDKWFPSSQMCHSCGTLHPEMKNLKIRTFECDCGLILDRDQNAAINILNEGLRILVQKAS